MPATSNLTYVTDDLDARANTYVSWAGKAVLRLYDDLHDWQAVAQRLEPYLDLSGANWWRVGRGECVTLDKINALRAYYGLATLTASYRLRRERRRATIQVQPETRAMLRAERLDGESFDAAIRRLLEVDNGD